VAALGGGDAGDALGRPKWVNETWSTYLPLNCGNLSSDNILYDSDVIFIVNLTWLSPKQCILSL
jgi:hypothetical protein